MSNQKREFTVIAALEALEKTVPPCVIEHNRTFDGILLSTTVHPPQFEPGAEVIILDAADIQNVRMLMDYARSNYNAVTQLIEKLSKSHNVTL